VLLGKSKRFSKSRALGHLENAFASEDSQKCEVGDDIDIVRAEDPRSEVRYTARQICEYVQNKNTRYRDIAVIASDLSEYEHYIKAIFEDYGIPYFIDTRQPMSMHPGVGAVNSALKAVSEGYEPSDIFAYLKSGLIPAEPGSIDILENYCLCFGVNSQAWKGRKDWRFEDPSEPIFDEDKINRIKESLLRPLHTLEEQLKPGQEEKISAGAFVRAVYSFLEDSGLKERLSEWIKTARDAGDIEQAERHRQFYGKLIELLDEITEVFGEALLGASQWREILESGFEEVRLGFVPAALDEVLVGSVERSRHPDLKAVFILGASQKNFPVPVETEGLLEDNEREFAQEEGFQLGQTVTETLACRQYLAYIAFTRASEYLCICYPAADSGGAPQLRSRFVDTVESLFSDLGEKEWVSGDITAENSKREFELRELLCSGLGADSVLPDDTEKYRSILDMLEADGGFEKTTDIVKSSLNYKNRAVLSKQTAEQLFPAKLTSSSTKLGCYAQCPFRYFAEYVLSLEKRREFALKPLDVGSFYHNVLDSLCRRLKSESKMFADLPEDELVGILHKQIEKVMGDNNFISQFKNRKDHNVYVITSAIRELEECVTDIRELELAGDFKPEYSEVEFGYGRSFLGDLQFKLGGNRSLNLRGKIDRIDICREPGKEAVVIIDYKTGKVKFDYASFYHGLDLQLPLYMLAVRRYPDLPDIAGGFLMPIKSFPPVLGLQEIEKKKDDFQRIPRGVINGEWAYNLDNNPGTKSHYYTINFYKKSGEPYSRYHQGDCLKPEDFELLLDFAKNKAIETGQKILSGDISVTPYKFDDNSTACKYCDYRSVCRYDWQINEANYLEKVGKKEFLERLKNNEC
jgi:ATP-dependent helicase/nuclease subunit B